MRRPSRPVSEVVKRSVLVSVLAWACLIPPPASCYSGGAPTMACKDMFPTGHGAKAQTTEPPYKIIVPKKKYAPNTTIKIRLETTNKTTGYFRGLLVEARRIGCSVNTTVVVGAFTINDYDLQTLHCMGQIHSAITHTSNSKKTQKDIYWTPPVVPAGHVVIRATFVKKPKIFWVNVESDVLVDLQALDTPKCISTYRPIPTGNTTPFHPRVASTHSGTTPPVHISRDVVAAVVLVLLLSQVSLNL